MGYHNGGTAPQNPRGGHRYYVDHGTPHTLPQEFFIISHRRMPGGNRLHPLLRSAAIFIYRHPFDVLLSEASWYSNPEHDGAYGYFHGLSEDQRIRKIINDPWLFGSIRDRVAKFAAWLDFPNVIPVAFEELVGEEGGASAQSQRALIWSLQLKLHVAGSPDDFARAVFNPQSPTFRQGQAGTYRTKLSAEARQELDLLPRDYLDVYGYRADYGGNAPVEPARCEEFRRRSLLIRPTTVSVPILVEQDYLGYNLVYYRDRFFGLLIGVPGGDLRKLDDAALNQIPNAAELKALRHRIAMELAGSR